MMASLTKKQKDNDSKIETGVRYSMTDALNLVKDCATAKFDESIDISINLGIDSKKSDQNIRGAVVLPNGTGKVVRVAVFTQVFVLRSLRKATTCKKQMTPVQMLLVWKI